MSEAAVTFLKNRGSQSLVSLGCGDVLRQIDNHVRLFLACGLEHYVAIDRVTNISYDPDTMFSDNESMRRILASRSAGRAKDFFRQIITFPDTFVEELENIRCSVVVCQRVLPFRHWEEIIKSMRPLLILQEDLRGCEKQMICHELYKKTIPSIIHYQLQPFKIDSLFPGERNLILWRRRDFYPCCQDMNPWWKRVAYCLTNITVRSG